MPFSLSFRERGQVLLAVALLVPVLLGMSAMAVDIGSYADDKRSMQNAADAIALAAAQNLCKTNASDCSTTTAATTAANAYATANNIDTSGMTLTYSGLTPTGGVFASPPTAHVTLVRTHHFAFARIIGINGKDVTVVAGAARVSPTAIPGVLPFAVTSAGIAGGFGSIVPIHESGGNCSNGNCGSIQVDQTGKANNCSAIDAVTGSYVCDIQHGSPSVVCSTLQANCALTPSRSCPGTFPDQCGTNAPSCKDQGPICPTEPGTGAGPMSAIQYRIDNTSSNCDTFDEVFTPASAKADEQRAHLLVVSRPGAGGDVLSPADLPNANPKTDTPTPPPGPTATSTPAPTASNTPGPTATNTPVASPTPIGGGSGKYTLNPNCNPWAGPGQCPPPANDDGQACSRRVIVVPVIQGNFGNGNSDVTIVSFALMFLNGPATGDICQGQNGGHCVVSGTYVQADVTVGALSCSSSGVSCAYDPTSSIRYAKLVE